MLEEKIDIEKNKIIKKTEKMRRGVGVSQLGGSLPPPGGCVKISLLIRANYYLSPCFYETMIAIIGNS